MTRATGERRSQTSKTVEIHARVHRPDFAAPHLRSELTTSRTSAIQACCQRCSYRQRNSQRQVRQQPSPSCALACLTCYLALMRTNTSRSWSFNPLLSEPLINERKKLMFSTSRTRVSRSILSATANFTSNHHHHVTLRAGFFVLAARALYPCIPNSYPLKSREPLMGN